MPMGFSILFKYPINSWYKELIVSIAGPITNFAIAGGFIILNHVINNEAIIYANLLIGLFNMLPIVPLDGGRIIKAILKKYYANDISENYIHNISNTIMVLLTVFASIGTFYFKNIAIPIVIIYLWVMVLNENKRYNIKKRMKKILENDTRNFD